MFSFRRYAVATFSVLSLLALSGCILSGTSDINSITVTLGDTDTGLVAGVCTPVQVSIAMSNGEAPKADFQASLSGAKIYSDSVCSTLTTSLFIPGTKGSATVYVMDQTMETLTIVASIGSQQGSLSVTVTAGPPHTLQLDGKKPLSVGVCSPFVISAKDNFGNPASVAGLSIGLSEDGSASFFLDKDCSTNAVTSADIPSDKTQFTVYVLDDKSESLTLKVSDTGSTNLDPVSFSTGTVVPGDATNFLISRISAAVTGCMKFSLGLTDQYGNLVNASDDEIGIISGVPKVYSNATCTTVTPNVKIPKGLGSTYFYIMDTKVEMLSLTAATSTNGFMSPILPVSVAAGAAVRLKLTPPSSFSAGVCAQIMVTSTDAYFNPSAVSSARTVILAIQNATGAALYSNNNCTTAIAVLNNAPGSVAVSLPKGQSQVPVYFLDKQAEFFNLTASDSAAAGALSSTQLSQTTVNPGPAKQIVFNWADPIVAGTCTAITFALADQFGNQLISNVDVTGIAVSGTNVYSDLFCQTPSASLTLSSGILNALYIKHTKAGTVTLTPSCGSTYTCSPHQISVVAAQPSKFVWTAPPRLTAGVYNPLTLSMQDPFNNPATFETDIAVDLTATNSANFFSSAQLASLTYTVVFPKLQSSMTLYVIDNSAGESVTLTALSPDYGGLTGVLTGEVVQAGAPMVMVPTIFAPTLIAGTCNKMTMQLFDNEGNMATATSPIVAGLVPTNGHGSYYSDSTCTQAITQVTVAAGATNATYYFKDTVYEAAPMELFQATDPGHGLAPCGTGLSEGCTNIAMAPPTVLPGPGVFGVNTALTTNQLITNQCVAIPLKTANGANVTANYPIDVKVVSGNLTFYSDPNCATSIGSAGTVTMGSGLAAVNAYVMATSPGAAVVSIAGRTYGGPSPSPVLVSLFFSPAPVQNPIIVASPSPTSTVNNPILLTIQNVQPTECYSVQSATAGLVVTAQSCTSFKAVASTKGGYAVTFVSNAANHQTISIPLNFN